MNSLNATIRNNKSKGELNSLRVNGNVPAIIYGGTEENKKISLSKKEIKMLIQKENFLSNMLNLKIDGKDENVLPRQVTFDVVSDEPIPVSYTHLTLPTILLV